MRLLARKEFPRKGLWQRYFYIPKHPLTLSHFWNYTPYIKGHGTGNGVLNRQHSHKQLLIFQERPTGRLKTYNNHLSAPHPLWILQSPHTYLVGRGLLSISKRSHGSTRNMLQVMEHIIMGFPPANFQLAMSFRARLRDRHGTDRQKTDRQRPSLHNDPPYGDGGIIILLFSSVAVLTQ